MGRAAFFDIFENIFSVWITRWHLDSWMFLLSTYWDIFFWLKYIKRIWPQISSDLCSCKIKSSLISFADNIEFWGVLYHNIISESLLKISCNMESETILMNILYSVPLKHYLALGMDLLSIQKFVITCIGHYKILLHWFMQIFHMLTYFTLQYKK